MMRSHCESQFPWPTALLQRRAIVDIVTPTTRATALACCCGHCPALLPCRLRPCRRRIAPRRCTSSRPRPLGQRSHLDDFQFIASRPLPSSSQALALPWSSSSPPSGHLPFLRPCRHRLDPALTLPQPTAAPSAPPFPPPQQSCPWLRSHRRQTHPFSGTSTPAFCPCK